MTVFLRNISRHLRPKKMMILEGHSPRRRLSTTFIYRYCSPVAFTNSSQLFKRARLRPHPLDIRDFLSHFLWAFLSPFNGRERERSPSFLPRKTLILLSLQRNQALRNCTARVGLWQLICLTKDHPLTQLLVLISGYCNSNVTFSYFLYSCTLPL